MTPRITLKRTILFCLVLLLFLAVTAYFVSTSPNHQGKPTLMYDNDTKGGSDVSSLVTEAELTAGTSRLPIVEKPPEYHPQLISVPGTTIKVYSAYLDDRKQFYGTAIYVLGIQVMSRQLYQPLYAKVVYRNNTTVSLGPSKVAMPCDKQHCNRFIHYTKYDTVNYIFQLTEKLNFDNLPVTISLSKNQSSRSELSSAIKIYNYRPVKKKPFGVCLQTPVYGRITKKLVHFIEFHRILGAETFTVYSMVDGLVNEALLNTYLSEDLLQIIPWPKQFKRTYPVHYFGQILLLHDCLYRNMHSVDYLVFVDLDEAIVPRIQTTWQAMITLLNQKNPKLKWYMFLNVYFVSKERRNNVDCDEVDYFTKLSRVACTFVPYRRSKFIVKTNAVNNIDTHAIATANVASTVVPASVGSLYHFRNRVTSDCKNRTLIDDTLLLKFKEQFVTQTKRFDMKIC